MHAYETNKKLHLILKTVSRSFYLSMVFLPRPMRAPISLAYLLARATDSVADSTQLPQEEKLAVLKAMSDAISGHQGMESKEHLLSLLSGKFAQAQEKAAEATLLQHFGACLELLHLSPSGEKVLIKKVLQTIIKGQSWDLEFFSQQNRVQKDEQTHEYTYMVAGCVGEFWTDLGILCMGPHQFCRLEDEASLHDKGIRYGCGLQLVNILRDREEDRLHGRTYLNSNPDEWMNLASSYLQDGLDYSLKLKSLRLRFTAMLPALLGLKTLQLLQNSPQEQEQREKGKAKITRKQVYACMMQALMMCQWRRK